MGKKYIIELEDSPFLAETHNGWEYEKLYRVKGFKSLVFDSEGLKRLTPYEEPQNEEQFDLYLGEYDACVQWGDQTKKVWKVTE